MQPIIGVLDAHHFRSSSSGGAPARPKCALLTDLVRLQPDAPAAHLNVQTRAGLWPGATTA